MKNGVAEACAADGYLRRGLACYKGYLTHEESSGIQGKPWVKPEVILGLQGRSLDPASRNTATRSDNYYAEFEDECRKG